MTQKLIAILKKPPKLTAKMNKTIVKLLPELEDLEVTPSGEEQKFKSNKYGFDNVTVKAIESEELIITPTAEKQIHEGLFKKVTIPEEPNYIEENIREGIQMWGITGTGKMQGEENTVVDTDNLQNYSGIDVFSPIGRMITKLPQLNTTNWTSGYCLFFYFKALKEIPKIDTQNMTTLSMAFYYCEELTELPEMNTENVTDISAMCQYCVSLKKVPKIEASKIVNVGNAFSSCKEITDFGGLNNYGEAFTATTENNYAYRFRLNEATKLTHDSLMNVINGLADLNLVYDVANGGTLYKQRVYFGGTNLAKLTEDEIQIGIDKGWVIQ